MGKIKGFLFLAICSLLIACAPPHAEQVMTPLSYNAPIDIHSNKTAYLYWKHGHDASTVIYNKPVGTDGLITGLVYSAVEHYKHKKNPGRYTFKYGKAQQAVFMTSLRDSLKKNNVFKEVVLASKPIKLGINDVAITVYFRLTSVGTEHDSFPITLDIDTSLKDNRGNHYNKSYIVYSKPRQGYLASKTFRQQQTEVSDKLLHDIMASIKQWHTHRIV